MGVLRTEESWLKVKALEFRCLEEQGDSVSILITLINHIITPVIQLMNLLPQSPGAQSLVQKLQLWAELWLQSHLSR